MFDEFMNFILYGAEQIEAFLMKRLIWKVEWESRKIKRLYNLYCDKKFMKWWKMKNKLIHYVYKKMMIGVYIKCKVSERSDFQDE